jgi:type I restriction-modification system DNA methylase subunit
MYYENNPDDIDAKNDKNYRIKLLYYKNLQDNFEKDKDINTKTTQVAL